MWEQLKKRIKNLFFTAEHSKQNRNYKQHKIKAKIKYQYPNNPQYRFQAISKQELETPAFQRQQKHEDNEDHLENDQGYLKAYETDQSKEPFKPSEVASPIYGYQPRQAKRDVNNVPAYVRKRSVQAEQIHINEHDNQADNVSFNQQKIIRKNKIDHYNNQVDKKHHEKEQVTKHINHKKEIKDKKKNSDQKKYHQATIKKSAQRKAKNIPYNVIMTPRDKKKLRENNNNLTHQNIVTHSHTDYYLPLHLLNDPEQSSDQDQLWIRKQQELLEKTLKHFNVKAKVVNATQGPTVTRFEVQPELGVKVSRVRNLSDDIKLNMAAKDIRIEAPIPGKHTIGIEVPNLKTQTVTLQEIFQTNLFKKNPSTLTIGLGLDVEGKPLITDITKMPHGLIAGATGSGKSVCINTILISLLYKASYEDVKLLLIDPKMVELAPYNGIPHLISPVITDMKAATAALKWAVNEMEERYERFVHEGVRSIDKYNEKMIHQNRENEKMPYIVIVIDELADLMMVAPQDVEDAICKLAQKARACGMHLLLATQRPSVDVITGLIKANIPTRIAFSVSSQVDSRTIIDMNGAERLLGKGDMLFIENGTGKVRRLQGAFVSDEEIERITNFVRKIATPNYLFEQEQLVNKIAADEAEDEILEDVIKFVIEQTNVSTSLLQRHFRIGYNRAARLIDVLENKGIISGQNGSKPRDILLSKDQLEKILTTEKSNIVNI